MFNKKIETKGTNTARARMYKGLYIPQLDWTDHVTVTARSSDKVSRQEEKEYDSTYEVEVELPF